MLALGVCGNRVSDFQARGRGLCVHGAGSVHGLVVRRARPLAQAIALPHHLHDGRVGEEAIEDGRAAGTSPRKTPQSRVGRLVVISVEVSCRRTKISSRSTRDVPPPAPSSAMTRHQYG